MLYDNGKEEQKYMRHGLNMLSKSQRASPLCMVRDHYGYGSTNERCCYIVPSTLIASAHSQNDPWHGLKEVWANEHEILWKFNMTQHNFKQRLINMQFNFIEVKYAKTALHAEINKI